MVFLRQPCKPYINLKIFCLTMIKSACINDKDDVIHYYACEAMLISMEYFNIRSVIHFVMTCNREKI